jgi:hypothetical protein
MIRLYLVVLSSHGGSMLILIPLSVRTLTRHTHSDPEDVVCMCIRNVGMVG